ncbi:hypothetical protein D8682_23245 [Buttiauxella sp. 3AFRM03]|jgi:hypothetical protein|nr:hypothetical protein D8682_23245 [Buttiauxella sp. 3AFRM03]
MPILAMKKFSRQIVGLYYWFFRYRTHVIGFQMKIFAPKSLLRMFLLLYAFSIAEIEPAISWQAFIKIIINQ